MPVYDRVPVAAEAPLVVAALRAVLAERGITEYAVVDHGRDMAAAGAPAFPAWTLIFGSPAAGSQILAHDLAAAVDIPLRLAVIAAADGGSEIVLRDMASLLGGDAAALAGPFTAVLHGPAEDTSRRVRLPPVSGRTDRVSARSTATQQRSQRISGPRYEGV